MNCLSQNLQMNCFFCLLEDLLLEELHPVGFMPQVEGMKEVCEEEGDGEEVLYWCI